MRAINAVLVFNIDNDKLRLTAGDNFFIVSCNAQKCRAALFVVFAKSVMTVEFLIVPWLW